MPMRRSRSRAHAFASAAPEVDPSSPLGVILATMRAFQAATAAEAASRLTGRAAVAWARATLALYKLTLKASATAAPYVHARKRAGASDDANRTSHDDWVLAMLEEERLARDRAQPPGPPGGPAAAARAPAPAPDVARAPPRPAPQAQPATAAPTPSHPAAALAAGRTARIVDRPKPHTHPATRPPPGRPSAVR